MNRSRSDEPNPAFDPIEFLDRAVAIESHDSVDELRALVGVILADHGIASRVDGAGTLIAIRGRREQRAAPVPDRDGPNIVFNTHLDTVSPYIPPEWGPDGDRLFGRGACDAMGPLAAILAAFLATDPETGRLTLVLTPDEEVHSTGAYALVDRTDSPLRDADAVIVGEPTGLDVCTAAPGRFEGMIELVGEHAHASKPDAGQNAVDALGDVLAALRSFDDRDDVPAGHPQLGDPTLAPTVVEGGEATNQVPASASVTVDRRPVPPETPGAFERALLAQLCEHVSADIDVSFAFTDRPTPLFESWATSPDHPIVRTLIATSGGDVRPFEAATEASYFAEEAPTVVFGPGTLVDDEGPVAHADREYVDIDEVLAAAKTLTETCAALCSE